MSDLRAIDFNVQNQGFPGHVNVTFHLDNGAQKTIGLNVASQMFPEELVLPRPVVEFALGAMSFLDPQGGPEFPKYSGIIHEEEPARGIQARIYVDQARFDAAYNYASSLVDTRVEYQLLTQACVDFANQVYQLAGGIGSVGNLFQPGEIQNPIGYRLLNNYENSHGVYNQDIYRNVTALTQPHCFPGSTQVRTPAGGSMDISRLRPGDSVLAFDPAMFSGRGGFVSKSVSRVFRNVTDSWLRLSTGLVVTPGHHFLTGDGSFRTIADILASDGQIVLEDGRIATVTGEYIHYSSATAGLFEEAEGLAFNLDGATALAPVYARGWRTYNFEVEDLHTYIAGGVRVHNASYFTASSQDIPVGTTMQGADGYTWTMNGDGSMTNNVGHTTPAAPNATRMYNSVEAASLDLGHVVSPSEQYSMASDGMFHPTTLVEGTGPSVQFGSGAVANAGTVFTSSNGYTYAINANGSVTNLDTGHTSGNGTTQYNPDTNTWVTVGSGSSSGGSSGSSGGGSGSGGSTSSPSTGGGKSSQNDNAQQTASSSGTAQNEHPEQNSDNWWNTVTSPLLLDLNGNGLKITEQSSSNMFYDMAGDGKQHHTAWAGAGNGVLVLDTANSGVITQRNQVDFTAWDPSAKTDMQALLDVFDTNHDGKLDAGDTDWSLFRVMVSNADGTTTLKTLAQLNITSINLVSNNQEIDFADGSKISGTASYTKSDGTTGKAGDASLSYDTAGYIVAKTVTVNPDGSTTIDNKADNADGSLANEIISTTSADGKSRTLKFDSNGDGVIDRVETIVSVLNADNSTTESLSNFDGSGTILSNRRATTTSADQKTVTISRDSTGSGTYFDQTETDATAADGSQTVTVTDLNANGSTRDKRIMSTSADGLTKSTQTQLTGTGAINATTTDTISVAGNGTRTETVTAYKGTGSTAAYEVGQTVTAITADGSNHSVASDLDGNGTTDLTTTSVIVHNADNSTTTTVTDSNGDGSLRDKTVTLLSADGKSKTTQTDADGNGVYELTTSDVTVLNADGSTTETIIKTNANAGTLSKSVATWSADGKTRTTSIDRDGDGNYDQIETVAIVSGNSVDTVSKYSPNGATLISKSVTTTSADGLTQTVQSDVNGDGTVDGETISVTVVNADHSSTVTQTTLNGAGTITIGKTVTTTSANGLSVTTQVYLDAQTSPYETTTDVSVLNADGSTTRTVTTFEGTALTQTGKTVTTTSADRRTSTTSSYLDTNSAPESVVVSVTNTDGSKTQTVSSYSPNGVTLISRQVTTVSADGLTTTATTDANGDGVTDATTVNATTLNADGSTTKTTTVYSGSGTGAANETGQTSTTVSGNGLSVTTLVDANGDGVIDSRTTDVTVLNADGSKVETVTSYSDSAGTHQTGKTVTATSATGLSKTMSTYLGADTVADHVSTDVTVLNNDGSKTETDTEKSANGTIVAKSTTVTSGNGLSVAVSTDLDGNGVNDIVAATTTNADGSVSRATSTYSATGVLTSKSTMTVSGSGLSTTTTTDLDGNGTTDKSKTDVTVINSDGSKTQTISDFGVGGVLVDKIVITTSADGLSTTTQWDDTGAGSFARTKTDVATVNTDGSRTEVVSFLNANGSLHDKSTTVTSGDGTNVTVTRDINGDGIVDETFVTQRNTDGSTTISDMDGVVQSASGRLYGATHGAYETVSANGLSKTWQYDANGDGLAESQRTDVTVLNADGSRTETIADSTLSGGSASAANPVYTVTPRDKEVITTSANGLSKTTQWDLTGSGSFGESRTDQTTLNADGSRTETVSLLAGTTLKSRQASTVSADGLTVTRQLDATGSGTYTQTQTQTTVLNADGTKTITTTAYSLGGGEMSSTTEAISADGRTKTYTQDPTGWGNVTQSTVDSLVTLADGQTVETVADYYGNLGSLKDKTTTTTSGDGRTVSISRDNNGGGLIDQTVVITQFVDGSSSIVTTDLTLSGGTADKSTTTVSADGLVVTTQTDLNGNGIIDQTTNDTRVNNADGSTQETVQTYQTSHLVNGVETSMSPVLVKSVTTTASADGLTRTVSTDVDGNGTTDQTSITVTKIDGSTVTTVSNNSAARNVAPIAGQVLWSSSLVATDKTVAASVITTTSADGLSKTVQADYDGNGTYEHTESWQVAADGSQFATIVDVNGSGTAVARGYETISADGLTTTLYVDATASGQIVHKDTAIRRVDGSVVETVVDVNSDGTLNKRVVSTISANGQNVSPVTTTGPGTSWTISASNTTPNDYGIDGKATVSGTGNIISFGNAVDVAVLNGNNNTIDETGGALVTVTGTGTGEALHAINRDNVANISSASLEIENDSSLTLEGSSNTITAFNNANLLLWSGTGNTLYVNGVGDVATMSGSTIQLWNGSSLTLTGSNDSITVYNNTTLDIASGTGDTLYVNGTGDAATLSGATVQVWDGSTVTLTGIGNAIKLWNSDQVAIVGNANTLDIAGTGATITTSGGSLAATFETGATATINGNGDTVTFNGSNTLAASGSGDVLNDYGTSNYATMSSGTVVVEANAGLGLTGTGDNVKVYNNGNLTVSSATDTVDVLGTTGVQVTVTGGGGQVTIENGAFATVFNSNNTITLGTNGSVALPGTGDIVNANSTGGYAQIHSGTVNIGANGQVSVDGTGDTINMATNSQSTVMQSGDVVNVNGTGVYSMISSGTVNVAANEGVSVDGTGDTINMASNSQATVMQSGDVVNSNGTSVYAMISHGTVNIGANDQASVDGTYNTINFGHSSKTYAMQGNDTFVFAPNFGNDSIAGFVASGSGADTVNIDHTIFADWAHLLAASSQSGSDVLITKDASDTILLRNTTLASLQSSQFHFT